MPWTQTAGYAGELSPPPPATTSPHSKALNWSGCTEQAHRVLKRLQQGPETWPTCVGVLNNKTAPPPVGKGLDRATTGGTPPLQGPAIVLKALQSRKKAPEEPHDGQANCTCTYSKVSLIWTRWTFGLQ